MASGTSATSGTAPAITARRSLEARPVAWASLGVVMVIVPLPQPRWLDLVARKAVRPKRPA